MEDRISWNIKKDEELLNDLMALIDLNDDDKALLTALQQQAQVVAPQLSEAFYRRLLVYPPTLEYVENKVDHLKKTLQEWFVQLFQGSYNQTYVQSRLAIGEVHVRIGLPVRYPLAMIDLIITYGREVTNHSSQPEQAMDAFNKLLALDIAIFNHAYESTQLQHLAHMVGNERLARRLLAAEK